MKELDETEVRDLQVFMRATKDARVLKRAQMVWMSHRGFSVPEIADALDVTEETVRDWLRRHEERGLDGLDDDPRSGRPAKAGVLYVRTLLALVPKSPTIVGYHLTAWTLELLARHLEKELGIVLSRERVRQILAAHEISFRRPKLHPLSNDPEYDRKVAFIDKLKKRLPARDHLYFEDESEVHLNPIIAKQYQNRGEQVRVLCPPKDRRVNLFGAVNYNTHDVIKRQTTRKRSLEFVAFLRQLLDAHPSGRIWVVLDNFSMHFTKRVNEFIGSIGSRIRFVPLPTYSPNLNIIEPFWKYARRHISVNRSLGTENGLKNAIRKFFRGYGTGSIRRFKFAT